MDVLLIDNSDARFGVLAANGHNVHREAGTAALSTLEAAWGSGKDLIVVHGGSIPTIRDFLFSKWPLCPILMSGATTDYPQQLGLDNTTVSAAESSTSIVIPSSAVGHPALAGKSGTVVISSVTGFTYRLRGTFHGTPPTGNGTNLASANNSGTGLLGVWEKDAVLYTAAKLYSGTIAPNRAGYIGFTESRTTFTTDGNDIILATAEWLVANATPSPWSYWDGMSEIPLPNVSYWDGTSEIPLPESEIAP